MAVNPDLLGRRYPRTASVEVTPERVAAFAGAVKATAPGTGVPPTFAVVVQQAALDALLADPSTGIVLERTVHGEQRFAYRRDLVVGDVLTGELGIIGIRALGPAAMVTAETVIRDAADAVVATATSVLVIGSEEA